jgi:hypothetical protein
MWHEGESKRPAHDYDCFQDDSGSFSLKIRESVWQTEAIRLRQESSAVWF